MRILGNKIVYDPAGECIYCGATSAPLSLEHIVPFALNGDLELPEASCAACAKITGAVLEQHVLRQVFPHLRNRLKLRTRRPKERATHFEIGVGARSMSLPISELPMLSWFMPSFGWPGILIGLPPKFRGAEYMQGQVPAADVANLLGKTGGVEPIRLPGIQVDPNMFRIFLAKVAHSFAYAHMRSQFDPLLPSLIRGDAAEHPSYFVGSEPYGPDTQAEANLYELKLGTVQPPEGPLYLGCRIRLFGYLRTPSYIVVVGRPREGFEIPQDAWYEKPIKFKIVEV